MKIKDIVNREIVNLTNCEQEPIHIPGSIQPGGFLLGFKGDNYTIDFCSGNINSFTGLTHAAVLGKSYKEIFGKEAEDSLKKYLSGNIQLSSPLVLNYNDRNFLCSVHFSNGICVLEAEPSVKNENELPGVYEQTKEFLLYLGETSSLQQLCQSVSERIRELTGYDRVMIYRFDEEYNGEVFAESLREDLERFLGLHYPHTDIPAQARELYIKNLLRIIGDINYTPVPIYTIDDQPGKNLDLSLSVLRSVSPIHVQYLQNMGVAATLTISLIHKGRLWGLIACHHYSAKNITPQQRIAAMLQGQFITSQIDIRQANEEYEVAKKSNDILEQFLSASFPPTHDSFKEIISNTQWLEICNAAGACIVINNAIAKVGQAPSDTEISKLAGLLAAQTNHTSFQTSNLSAVFPEVSVASENVAGLLYYSLNLFNNDCIIWFRPEIIVEVNWAGDPAKAIVKNEKGLHPRKSFKLWKEVVKGKSKPWLRSEVNAAASYSYGLQKHVGLVYLTEEENKLRKLSASLKESNEELESINWISTHDLQEPLRKIQMFSSRVLAYDDNTPHSVINENVKKMNESAHRMQNLLRDLLNHVRIKETKEDFVTVNLDAIAAEVIQDVSENITEKKAIIETRNLPAITGVPFLIKQLFINLISNSLKFTDPAKAQRITIRGAESTVTETGPDGKKGSYQSVEISDTGIGFENKYAESIFKIFTRLHGKDKYEGSGIGLALCKKIMSIHEGMITASGNAGGGATFTLFFPVS
jgi:light-regulated signal transduction histidine kinase (bacteriophytochrome)